MAFVTLRDCSEVRRAVQFCEGSIGVPAPIAALTVILLLVIEVVDCRLAPSSRSPQPRSSAISHSWSIRSTPVSGT
jgi:hypothetical protein